MAAGLAGCVVDAPASDSPATETRWSHGVGGSVEAVADGLVFGRESFADATADGGIYALDAATGDQEWVYGETSGYDTFTDLVVTDAVYAGYGDDAIGSGAGSLYAVDFDGSERWEGDTGSVYDPPLVADGAVFASSDDGLLRAFEADSGARRWEETPPWRAGTEPDPFGATIAGVPDDLAVVTDRLFGLDTATGDVTWRFDRPEPKTALVDGETVYVRTDADVLSAVAAGEEQWQRDLGAEEHLLAVVAGVVLTFDRDTLRGFDAVDGEHLWTVDDLAEDGHWRVPTDVDHGTCYFGGAELRAVDLADGDLLWTLDLGNADDRVTASAVEDGVYAWAGETLVSVVDGEVVWEGQFGAGVRSVVAADEVLAVATSDAIHGLEWP